MGLFAPNTRKFDGIEHELSAEFETREEAEYWQRQAQQDGFHARILSNANKQRYELWVSLYPLRREVVYRKMQNVELEK